MGKKKRRAQLGYYECPFVLVVVSTGCGRGKSEAGHIHIHRHPLVGSGSEVHCALCAMPTRRACDGTTTGIATELHRRRRLLNPSYFLFPFFFFYQKLKLFPPYPSLLELRPVARERNLIVPFHYYRRFYSRYARETVPCKESFSPSSLSPLPSPTGSYHPWRTLFYPRLRFFNTHTHTHRATFETFFNVTL
ncbi:hypothetical protein B0F90DRAFT_971402 [Multifurca ochricompacta]|uniref:Uncharacterized protein n=1 Tax=Multifurca ochricompacta TaxID=376703 RepID=A0AAD4M9A3_9AGAM|nr:hypothetical protein B0F90DRAFT_971402 [Multifurca ochricompacta]